MCDSSHLFSREMSANLAFSEISQEEIPQIVDHSALLSEQYKVLLESGENSDVTLVVAGKKFKAHRLILATQCEYFRALFYGGMIESQSTSNEVVLHNTPSSAFEHVLKYLYYGSMALKELKEDDIVDILGLSHSYGLESLETAACSYLEMIINVSNVITIFNAAAFYEYKDLLKSCHAFMDHNAMDVLASGPFNNLTLAAAKSVLSRDSFCAPEIEIFRCVRKWLESNALGHMNEILDTVRLPLISLHELFDEVRPSNLYTADRILDAIQEKTECSVSELTFRGHLVDDENIAKRSSGAEVIEGDIKDALLDDQLDISRPPYDNDHGCTRHVIEPESPGIIVALGRPSIINTITLHLWDKDSRSYSYKLDCSVDKSDWTCLADYSTYQCRSLQLFSFAPRVIRYIRVTGTHNSANKYFHLIALRCYHSSNPSKMIDGFVVPSSNVASTMRYASVVEGVSRNRNALIDGDTEHYDWESGYTCHQIGSGCIIIQFAQPFLINSMRMLLWDCDDRSYSYYIEVSLDTDQWTMVADQRENACKGWQEVEFSSCPASFIKIVGTRNTANEVFHVVHFECPPQRPEALSETTSVDTDVSAK